MGSSIDTMNLQNDHENIRGNKID